MKQPVNVAITGAAGQIGYALAFRVASGAMLGADQPVNLHLLEITPATGGQTWFLAFTRDTVPELHIAGGWLLVAPPAEDETEVE